MTRKPSGLEEQLRAVSREQIKIEVADGQMEAYRAAPGEGKGPGVVVVTHVFGIDQDMMRQAERYYLLSSDGLHISAETSRDDS